MTNSQQPVQSADTNFVCVSDLVVDSAYTAAVQQGFIKRTGHDNYGRQDASLFGGDGALFSSGKENAKNGCPPNAHAVEGGGDGGDQRKKTLLARVSPTVSPQLRLDDDEEDMLREQQIYVMQMQQELQRTSAPSSAPQQETMSNNKRAMHNTQNAIPDSGSIATHSNCTTSSAIRFERRNYQHTPEKKKHVSFSLSSAMSNDYKLNFQN